MSVDLKQLAIDRGGAARGIIAPPRRVISRYVLPVVLLTGFVCMFAWAARDAFLPRTKVTVVPVNSSRQEIHTSGTPLFKAAGWVEPRPTPIRVAALAEGVIRQLLVVEDQAVAVGEPIAYLVDDDARLSVDAAKATLNLRTAELKQRGATLDAALTNLNEPTYLQAAAAESQARLANVETELGNLPFQLAGAEAKLQFGDATLKAQLNAGTAVSEIEVDEARSMRDSMKATFDELARRKASLQAERNALASKRDAEQRRLELKTDEHQAVEESQALLQSAAANLEQARVALAEAQLRFDRMTIRAPVDGRVMHLLTSPGTRLSGGQGRLGDRDSGVVVTLYQPSKLQIRVDVRFEDLPQTGRDQPVLIESPALPQPLQGRVLFPTSFADIQKNTLSVKVAIDDPPEVMKPDMLVDVTFLSPEKNSSTDSDHAEHAAPMRIYVPHSLIQTNEAGTFVWIADLLARTAHRRRVQIRKTSTAQDMVEVTDGLNIASRLITSGFESLNDGDRIEVLSHAH
ncbi:MAG: HlyD family efflux transporter periplasmic adaptor subunit [Planctomycetota bacterium]|nr:HlyD family efflux transporter periplasmic adaptor subunit [Planctomycetota bacterium]MDA1164350.1 HlyD family efflux transporter periplasmic adaptor subunit [Planctomycetota bacterium]